MASVLEQLRPAAPPNEGMPKQMAADVLSWYEHPHTALFLDWIRGEAERAVAPGAHMDMVVAATRANTMREILAHVKRIEKQAQVVMDG